MTHYPAAFSSLLRGVMLLLFISGLLLAPGALEMRLEWSLPWTLDSGSRVWAALTHATAYFLMLLLLGALWTVHMRAGWLRRENVFSGASLLVLFALLALSGLGLYYLSHETLASLAVLLHLVGGLSLPILLWIHMLGAKAAQSRVNRPGRKPVAS